MHIDLASIYDGSGFVRYNVSLLGYGYFGDCILDSETHRWMGPMRYEWAGMFSYVKR